MYKTFHIVISLLGEYEKCDDMIDSQIIKIRNVRSDKLKDEHNVISFVEIYFFIFLQNLTDFLLLLILFNPLIWVNMLFYYSHYLLFNLLLFYTFLFLSINIIFIYFYVLIVKVYILFCIYPRAKSVNHLLLWLD